MFFAHVTIPPLLGYALAQAGSGMHPDGWASLGVGGMLAGVVFYFYRQDRLDSKARHEALIEEYKAIAQQQQRVTMALIRLVGDAGGDDDTQN